jgi:hypothetical protein
MFAANTYRVRFATDEDTFLLRRMAHLDSVEPLPGPVLIGEIGGTPRAALSLRDGRVLTDPSPFTSYVLAGLRVRAAGVWARAATPSWCERTVGAMNPSSSADAVATSASMASAAHG